MQIQGSINQLLSMAAIGIRLSPAYEKMQAKQAKQRELKDIERSIGAIAEEENIAEKLNEAMNIDPSTPIGADMVMQRQELAQGRQEELHKLIQRRARLDPTPSNYGDLILSQYSVNKGRELANQRAQIELNARQTEVRGNQQPTITQMLGKDPEVASSNAAWERTIRRDLNGNNQ